MCSLCECENRIDFVLVNYYKCLIFVIIMYWYYLCHYPTLFNAFVTYLCYRQADPKTCLTAYFLNLLMLATSPKANL